MLEDSAVIEPTIAHVLINDIGAADPTWAQVLAFDPNVSTTIGSEVNTIGLGAASAGTITMTVDGSTTGSIAFNATAATVQTALESLPNVDPGDVVASGGPFPGVITLTWGGRYAGVDVPTPTATPTALTGGTVTISTTSTAWRNLGHTDLDDDFDAGEDGGDSETRGTRQNPNLRERTSAVTQFLQLSLLQMEGQAMRAYHGGGTETANTFDAPDAFTNLDKAVLIIYLDGTDRVGEYYPKASIRRNGAISRAAGAFMKMPIRITPLKLTGKPIVRWLSDEFKATVI